MEGFCKALVKPLGPVQLYAAPETVVAVRLSVSPSQSGVFAPAVGDGISAGSEIVSVLVVTKQRFASLTLTV